MRNHIKHLKFKSTEKPEYFHLNFEYNCHQHFPELDWMLINYQINRLANNFKIELHALVMMQTHCHLLFKCENKNENYFTDHLLSELQVKNIDHTLVEPITNITQYLHTYRYIYRNPVAAGACYKVEEYKFSSIYALLGKSQLQTQIIDPLSLIQNPNRVLKWLNNHETKKFFQFNSAPI